MNLHWPHKPGNGLRPWYNMILVFPWVILHYIGKALAFVGVLMANGLDEAKLWWGFS